MAKKSEGTEVRHAMNGPDIEHDQLIGNIDARNYEDTERASSAGESRSKIGGFLEQTGMNAKAYSVCRLILKQKTIDKQMDIIRSLETALPMIKAHVSGQQSEMDLNSEDNQPVEPVPFDDGPKAASYTSTFDPADADDEIAKETEAFEEALAEAAV